MVEQNYSESPGSSSAFTHMRCRQRCEILRSPKVEGEPDCRRGRRRIVVGIVVRVEAEDAKQVSQQGLVRVIVCKTVRCACFVVVKKVIFGIVACSERAGLLLCCSKSNERTINLINPPSPQPWNMPTNFISS